MVTMSYVLMGFALLSLMLFFTGFINSKKLKKKPARGLAIALSILSYLSLICFVACAILENSAGIGSTNIIEEIKIIIAYDFISNYLLFAMIAAVALYLSAIIVAACMGNSLSFYYEGSRIAGVATILIVLVVGFVLSPIVLLLHACFFKAEERLHFFLNSDQIKKLKKERMRIAFEKFTVVYNVICTVTSLFLIFLPVFMRFLCWPIFELTFEEFVLETQANEISLLFTVYFVTGGVLMTQAYNFSITNTIAGVISIVITHFMYHSILITLILIGSIILGYVFKFLPLLLSGVDAFGLAIAVKWTLLGAIEIVYIVAAVELPAEFGVGIRFLFISGAVVYGLNFFTMFDVDEDALKLKEARMAVAMIRINEWYSATDDGRYPLGYNAAKVNKELDDLLSGKKRSKRY